jgi:hypothetical protein
VDDGGGNEEDCEEEIRRARTRSCDALESETQVEAGI